ncbi:hypothetical protein B0H15DRAFT_540215 [Mycena belliarum]|uniref:Uncharacterized protein n=1 Tax=Mycena belliarum TaxID=1033014 RepID=A0AAD6XGT5_9AGAR|nr:hypothetical protein B0H15DRAFT_540215 [Mycena belliae]
MASTMNSTQPSSCFEANPDISGLGVRISFYVQTICLVFLAGRSLDEALNSVWTLLGTSFGLTVSALVSAAQTGVDQNGTVTPSSLPLYQAIIVTDLIWIANYAIFMALATYGRHPRGSHRVQYAALGQTYISMATILFLWARAPSDPNAHQTVFVVVFASVPAARRGRIIALTFTAVLLAAYSAVAYIFLFKRMIHSHKVIANGALQLPSTPVSPSPKGPRGPAPTLTAAAARPPPSLTVDPHLVTLSIFFGIPYIVTLVSTELQIRRNALCAGNSSWGFGQVLAMAMTIVPVLIAIDAYRKYGLRQRSRAAGVDSAEP